MSCTKDHKEGEDPKKKGPFSRLKESIDELNQKGRERLLEAFTKINRQFIIA